MGSRIKVVIMVRLVSQSLVALLFGQLVVLARSQENDDNVVLPMSPILLTEDANGDRMMQPDGIPTASIDEVCARTEYPGPWFCQEDNGYGGQLRLPIEVDCSTIVGAGYIPKGCDGAYMDPRDRRDYCDALDRLGQAKPYYCFAKKDRRRGGGSNRAPKRRFKYRGIDFGLNRGSSGRTMARNSAGKAAAQAIGKKK